MDMKSVIRHLITKEASFPAYKLVLDKQFDTEEFGELPKLTPTHYFNENCLSTEERHKLLSRQLKKISTKTRGMEVEVEPPIIVFQNYRFGETYTFPILVRNISKNSQKVAILMDESYVFKFDECSQRIAKFPCGMCITAAVTFTPENPMDDYYHKLVISTNNTKVVVPIIGIGPRPLLNAPDCVIFADSPVRCWSTKPVNVLNIGKKPAKFTLTAFGSFCVKPEKGIVYPNEAFTFEVAYYSPKVATHEGEIRLRYDNGEEIYIYLRANAVNCDIRLSSPDVRCEDTYVSLRTRSTFLIENNSNVTAKFYWKSLPEFDDMLRFYGRCDECPYQWEDGLGLDEALEKGASNPISYGLKPECEEIIQSMKGRKDTLFMNDEFQLYPVFGEIKPMSKIEIQVIFSPSSCAFYEGTAYLEINGIENRIPFSFYGRGLGPKFKLGFETLNVGEVAMGENHTYEIPLQNISEIPGNIQCEGLVGAPSGMGMKVEPPMIHVAPDQYGAFYVLFSCTGKPGPFQDEIKFVGQESGDTFYVTVTGVIIFPKIRFASDQMNIGRMSYGFPKTFSIPLINDSLNFINLKIKMGKDGSQPPIDYNTILTTFKNEKFELDKDPAEFEVRPRRFILKPRAVQKMELTMYPNRLREVQNKLRCVVTDKDGRDIATVASIEIRGAVVVANLETENSLIHMKECLLYCPYQAEFVIKNTTELRCLYCLIYSKQQNIDILTNSFVGIAEPWMETHIPFEFICTVSGEYNIPFDLYAVGSDDPMLTFHLKVEAIPSKIETSTRLVDFGEIEVLEEKMCSIDLINTFPIDFPFTLELLKDETNRTGAYWRLEPLRGVLPSQNSTSLLIYLMLKEVGWHYGGTRVLISEPFEHTIEVKMKALGVGCPLKIVPKLDKEAELDFGTLFIHQEKTFTFEVTNLGENPRAIEWKQYSEKSPSNKLTSGKSKKKKGKTKSKSKDKKKKGKGKRSRTPTGGSSKPGSPVDKIRPHDFKMNPIHKVIQPGETITMTITAKSSVARKAEELWNLWTYVPIPKPPTPTKNKKSKGKKKGKSRSKKSKSPKGKKKKKKGKKSKKGTSGESETGEEEEEEEEEEDATTSAAESTKSLKKKKSKKKLKKSKSKSKSPKSGKSSKSSKSPKSSKSSKSPKSAKSSKSKKSVKSPKSDKSLKSTKSTKSEKSVKSEKKPPAKPRKSSKTDTSKKPPKLVKPVKSVKSVKAIKSPRSDKSPTAPKKAEKVKSVKSVKAVKSTKSKSPKTSKSKSPKSSKSSKSPKSTKSGKSLKRTKSSKGKGKGAKRARKESGSLNEPPKVTKAASPQEPADLHYRPVVYSEVKFKAKFEQPEIKFSKKLISFLIEATPMQENFVMHESLAIQNEGTLPVNIKLRCLIPFSFSVLHDDEQYEQNSFDLDANEVLDLKIRFDGQHLRKELGRIVFEQKLECICNSFFETPGISLLGEVRFPELILERNIVDFGHIINGSEAVQMLKVTNDRNFCLTYKWYVKPDSTTVQRNDRSEWDNDICKGGYRPSISTQLKVLKFNALPMPESNIRQTCKRKSIQRRRSSDHDAQTAQESFSHILGIRTNFETHYDDFSAFVKEKLYRSRMMEFMGLKDTEYEAEDETNYLAFYNQGIGLPKEEFNANELIDVIPLAGVVQAGQSLTLTFVFYGYPDITFKTTLVLYVEGGARKYVEVIGSTGPSMTPDTPESPEDLSTEDEVGGSERVLSMSHRGSNKARTKSLSISIYNEKWDEESDQGERRERVSSFNAESSEVSVLELEVKEDYSPLSQNQSQALVANDRKQSFPIRKGSLREQAAAVAAANTATNAVVNAAGNAAARSRRERDKPPGLPGPPRKKPSTFGGANVYSGPNPSVQRRPRRTNQCAKDSVSDICHPSDTCVRSKCTKCETFCCCPSCYCVPP